MKFVLLICAFLAAGNLFAKPPADSLQIAADQARAIDSIESLLHYRTGKIALRNGSILINVPPGYKFLDSTETRYLLEDIWGNLKGQTALGMLVPAKEQAVVASYVFLVSYEEMGFVKDDDAAKIDYDDLLIQMKEDISASNKERKEQGVENMNLVGWAAKPLYDEEQHVLYWAKELQIEGTEEHTLNYDIRVLGRKGVLVIQAVAGMNELANVEQNIDPLLTAVTFEKGSRYTDFNESTDNVAAWTIGGLVAGKVLAKVGFFGFILKFLKIIILGIVSLGGAAFQYFRRKKTTTPPIKNIPGAETGVAEEAQA